MGDAESTAAANIAATRPYNVLKDGNGKTPFKYAMG
jgi:hypothetical protein